MRRTDTPDPTTFPTTFPRWATWIKERNPQFKVHNHLGLAKNALSGRTVGHGRYVVDSKGKKNYETPLEGGYVYEWVADDDGEGWVERFHVPPGTYKSEHPFWEFTEKARKIRPVSQKAIDEAIRSIQQD